MLALARDIAERRQMSLILCSHLLRDVEQVCENVIVFNQGRVAASGRIAELTGPRRAVYDVRVKGAPGWSPWGGAGRRGRTFPCARWPRGGRPTLPIYEQTYRRHEARGPL